MALFVFHVFLNTDILFVLKKKKKNEINFTSPSQQLLKSTCLN